jgi:hypothetical protein
MGLVVSHLESVFKPITACQKYYLVDTCIIIYYMNESFPRLNAFIDNPNNHFYYTDTVRKEVMIRGKMIPEIFKYISSPINKEILKYALGEIKKDMKLTPRKIKDFENDLTIILEASYYCYEIESQNNEISLLTNNLKLLKKFINDKNNEEKLERIINSAGLEHLIEMTKMSDVVSVC